MLEYIVKFDEIMETDDNHQPFLASIPKNERTYWYQMIVHFENYHLTVALAHFYQKKCMDWAAYRTAAAIPHPLNVQNCCERGDKIDSAEAFAMFPQFSKFRWRN